MRTAEEIDAYIKRKLNAGSSPGNVANGIAVPVEYVRGRMLAMELGDHESSHANLYRVHPMWSTDGHELRTAIWQRQRDGAAATLRGRL